MEELVAIGFEVMTREPDPEHPEGWEINATIPVVIRFEPGAYMLALYLNDRFARSFAFRIALANGPPVERLGAE